MEPLWFFLASEQRGGRQGQIPRSEHGWRSRQDSKQHSSCALAKQKASRLRGRSFYLKRRRRLPLRVNRNRYRTSVTGGYKLREGCEATLVNPGLYVAVAEAFEIDHR